MKDNARDEEERERERERERDISDTKNRLKEKRNRRKMLMSQTSHAFRVQISSRFLKFQEKKIGNSS